MSQPSLPPPDEMRALQKEVDDARDTFVQLATILIRDGFRPVAVSAAMHGVAALLYAQCVTGQTRESFLAGSADAYDAAMKRIAAEQAKAVLMSPGGTA